MREANKVKLLLLGAGESGKSTVFKQMKVLYGKGLSDDEAKLIAPVVHSNMIVLLRAVMDQVETYGRVKDVSILQSSHLLTHTTVFHSLGARTNSKR